MLVAADELFATTAAPSRRSMDDAAAAAAGVGKDTLFRAFGSRAALIQALWELRTEPLRRAIESGPLPLGPGPIRASASWPFSTPRPGRREWSGS